jgi:hypothetical protein
MKARTNLEKQLFKTAYWIGIISTALALITRGLATIGVFIFPLPSPGRIPITYRTFLEGAILFFIMAIASSVAIWAKAQRS